MKAELWKKIDELFAAAQAQPTDQRAAFLDRACGGDGELRAELESLLNAATSDKSFLDHPAAPPLDQPALKAGAKLGAFEIVERIGRGGMGEVYRAHDSRLKRDVAIKVLPPDFADDPGRLRRFEHEARAASALNHPNIVSVHDVGSTDGISWMVTELVEGPSLREVLAKGAMPPRKAVEIAAQIGDGLSAAHAAGLVHRDLKAENVMLARPASGHPDLVKILDFGIAKRRFRNPATGTFTDTLTRTGEVIGTVTSMSPEQVEGKEVDHRSDIFSFGVLLYEMLSGKRPFTGDTHAAVMNAIVSADAPDLPANVPEGIVGIVRRCLEKLPERRFQSAADLGYALRLVIAAQPHVEPQRKHTRWPIAAMAVAGVVLAAAGTAYWWPRPATRSADLVSVPLMPWPGEAYMPTFSPDGNRVAFQWRSEKGDKAHIYIEQIGSGARPVQLTNGPADFLPAWSPDDKYIAFIRRVGSGYALMLVPSIGGPERKVADFPDWAGLEAWSPDSKWLAMSVESRQDPLSIWLVSASTGERRRLTNPPATGRGDFWPSISPDGRSIGFEREVTSVAFAPYVLKLSQDYRPEGSPRELTTMRYSDMGGMAWTADGREIVFSAGPMENESLFRVPASGRHSPARLPYVLSDAGSPIISPARSRLAYARGTVNRNLWRLDTRTGERKMLVGANGYAAIPQYSPSSRKIAFHSNRSGEWGVWTCDADGSNCGRLTAFGDSQGGTPRWSPDSQWIAFDSRVEGRSHIYVIQADGGGQRRMTNDPADDQTPSWSHDGRWIYFASDRSGRWETWKIRAAGGGTAMQVTRAGGGDAFESADGEYLYYVKSDPGPLFRMPVGGGAEIQAVPRVAHWAGFAIAAKAIYFNPDGKAIQRLELSSGKISTLATVEKGVGSLCVSPDEAFVVWSQEDRSSVELMLVEGFR